MLRVNKKIEYGVIALLYLAAKPDKTASVREIAATSRIPETLLSKVMQRMKSVGIVAAVYGNHGGYRLDRNIAQISLLDIMHVLDGPVHVAECLEPGKDACPCRASCTIISPMETLNQKIISLFQATSLEALATRKAV